MHMAAAFWCLQLLRLYLYWKALSWKVIPFGFWSRTLKVEQFSMGSRQWPYVSSWSDKCGRFKRRDNVICLVRLCVFCVLWELLEEEDFILFVEQNGVKLVDIGPVEAFPLDKIWIGRLWGFFSWGMRWWRNGLEGIGMASSCGCRLFWFILLRARVLSPPAIKQIELLSTFKPHCQLIRVFYHSILYCY